MTRPNREAPIEMLVTMDVLLEAWVEAGILPARVLAEDRP